MSLIFWKIAYFSLFFLKTFDKIYKNLLLYFTSHIVFISLIELRKLKQLVLQTGNFMIRITLIF